ncbi:hypothetical protein C8J56DRAFT_806535 [Mycena floridula]|nr:hypothetical protein C8J56DRAFT_806535 [Mycena floridula]
MIRGYQAKVSDLEGEIKKLKRNRLADVTNGDVDDEDESGDGEPAQKRLRAGDDSEARAITAQVKLLGRRFVVQYGMWLVKGTETFLAEAVDDYEVGERFENEENKVQGQLRELRECIPKTFHPQMENIWFGKTFVHEMGQQLSNIVTCIRQHSVTAIFGSERAAKMNTSSDRQTFLRFIGYKEETRTWSVFNVEALHGVYNGEYDSKQIFRSPLLKKAYAAIIRGPKGPVGLMEGRSMHPSSTTVEGVHHLTHTTPGAIALSAVAVRWALSPDVQLRTPGDQTGINYAADFDQYLERLLRGLRDRKHWARQLFREWDALLFPLHPSKFGGQKSSEEQQKAREKEIQETQDIDDAATESEESGVENDPIDPMEEDEQQSITSSTSRQVSEERGDTSD